jgi:hypothetical protein
LIIKQSTNEAKQLTDGTEKEYMVFYLCLYWEYSIPLNLHQYQRMYRQTVTASIKYVCPLFNQEIGASTKNKKCSNVRDMKIVTYELQ